MRFAIGRVDPLEWGCRPRRIPPGPGRYVRGEPRTVDSRHDRKDLRRATAIDLDSLVSANLGPIVVVLALAVAVLLVVVALLARRTSRLSGRLSSLTRGGDGRSLEAILDAHLGRVHDVVRDLDQLEARTAVVERDLQRAFGRVGLVRYNPFGDTGGNQSFALAVLDAHGDGFVVSSLHARQGTRMYAKAIKGGLAEAGLSDEETEAIRRALGRSPGAVD